MKSGIPAQLLLPAAAAAAGMLLAFGVVSVHPGILGLAPPERESAQPASETPRSNLAWSRLESQDDATFRANLRAIGCPEATIRRIVPAGPGAPVAASPAVSPAPVSRNVPPPPTPLAVPPPAFGGEPVTIVAPEGPVPLPVAFQPLPQDSGMTAEQRVRLNTIQEDFLADIGGLGQDPASEAYKDMWRRAQRKSDEQFKAAFGQAAFMRRQMAILRAEQSARSGR